MRKSSISLNDAKRERVSISLSQEKKLRGALPIKKSTLRIMKHFNDNALSNKFFNKLLTLKTQTKNLINKRFSIFFFRYPAFSVVLISIKSR